MKQSVFPDKIQRMVKLLYGCVMPGFYFYYLVIQFNDIQDKIQRMVKLLYGCVMPGFYFYYLVMQFNDIQDKIQRMVKLLYETFECTVLDERNPSE